VNGFGVYRLRHQRRTAAHFEVGYGLSKSVFCCQDAWVRNMGRCEFIALVSAAAPTVETSPVKRLVGGNDETAEKILCLGLCRRGSDPRRNQALGGWYCKTIRALRVTPPPKAEEITLRPSRVVVPSALQPIVRADHLTLLEHSYGMAWFDACRMFLRSVPNPPDAVAFPDNEQDSVRILAWCDQIRAKAIPYVGGSSVVKGIEPAAEFERVVTISMRHMD
jgi:hypothetical protein